MNDEISIEIDDISYSHPDWSAIVERAISQGLPALSREEQIRYLLGCLYGEIGNGGVGQWYSYCGSVATETVEVLELIGAKKTASIIRAIMRQFPNEQSDADEDVRGVQFNELSQNSQAFREDCKALEHWLMGEVLPNGEFRFAEEDPVRIAYYHMNRKPAD